MYLLQEAGGAGQGRTMLCRQMDRPRLFSPVQAWAVGGGRREVAAQCLSLLGPANMVWLASPLATVGEGRSRCVLAPGVARILEASLEAGA